MIEDKVPDGDPGSFSVLVKVLNPNIGPCVVKALEWLSSHCKENYLRNCYYRCDFWQFRLAPKKLASRSAQPGD